MLEIRDDSNDDDPDLRIDDVEDPVSARDVVKVVPPVSKVFVVLLSCPLTVVEDMEAMDA